LLHDRDTKFCESFRELIESGSKEECLAKLILLGEASLRRALQQYTVHYHEERNHQGKGNRILFPLQPEARREAGAVRCRERLGGLLKYYERQAA
jgi:putative transposase